MIRGASVLHFLLSLGFLGAFAATNADVKLCKHADAGRVGERISVPSGTRSACQTRNYSMVEAVQPEVVTFYEGRRFVGYLESQTLLLFVTIEEDGSSMCVVKNSTQEPLTGEIFEQDTEQQCRCTIRSMTLLPENKTELVRVSSSSNGTSSGSADGGNETMPVAKDAGPRFTAHQLEAGSGQAPSNGSWHWEKTGNSSDRYKLVRMESKALILQLPRNSSQPNNSVLYALVMRDNTTGTMCVRDPSKSCVGEGSSSLFTINITEGGCRCPVFFARQQDGHCRAKCLDGTYNCTDNDKCR
jgi:hypothetical protein